MNNESRITKESRSTFYMSLVTGLFAVSSLFMGMFLVPTQTHAFHDSGHNHILVDCNTTVHPDGHPQEGQFIDRCDFNKFMLTVKSVINFLLFIISIPLAAIMFAVAGVILLTSGGNTARKDTAKNIFINVAKGLALMLAAWIIIATILRAVGLDEAYSLINFAAGP